MQNVKTSILLAAAMTLASPLPPLWALDPTTQPELSTRPAATNRANNNHPATTQISLNFKDVPVDSVLDQLSDEYGFIVLKEVPITGRVTVLSKQPVSADEAVSLLNAALKVNGYTAIQMERTLKITSRDKAKKANIPVRFGADPKLIAQTDELITQVIPVRSVDAVKLKQDLQPLIGTDADVSSNGASNTLIVTDTSANVRRIVEIVSNLDKRDALENTIRVKQLKYADAAAAAKLITDIFKSDDQSQNQANVPPQVQFFRAMQRGAGGGATGQEQADKGRTGRVLASADQRTNTIVITGPADTLKVIDDVLDQLDANPASEQTFFIYSLKNGQSKKMEAVLNSLFGSGSSSASRTSGNTQNRNAGAPNAGFGTSNTGGGNRTGGIGAMGNTGGTSGFGTNNPINRNTNAGGTAVPSNLAGAAAELAGQVYVVADEDTNSLLVSTATKYQERVRNIITQLDHAVPQVLIKVLIAEVSHDTSEDVGVDFSILNQRANGNGQRGGSTFDTPGVQGGLVVSVLETNVQATLRALSTAGKLDVLSRPYILASDNQLASITVGQEVPLVTNSRVTDTGQTINSVSYRDVGIILNVTPHINPEGLVILDVSPEISALSAQSVPISDTASAPIIDKRSADSRVGIRDGQTIVIGGLMEDKKTALLQKVPILGDIPILGLLFRRNAVTKTKTELLIFLTPHVALQPDVLKPMSEEEKKGTKLTPNAVEPGAFDEHMRGMERGGHPTTQSAPEPSQNSAPTNDNPPNSQ
ncbi:MAG TPA: type II secretion system secretin GspD [Tepidisphaeraceae bacterium]